MIEELIPYGKGNAVSRKWLAGATGLTDREARREIGKAREERRVVILSRSDGAGYYRPLPEDADELNLFIRREKARALSILKGLTAAKRLQKELNERAGEQDGN